MSGVLPALSLGGRLRDRKQKDNKRSSREDFSMKKSLLEHGDWVVACDGRKALILENRGDEKFPNLRLQAEFEHPDRPTHVLGSSPPGRSYQSVGHGRSSVEQTDWHDRSERAFLQDLAKHLDRALADSKMRGVVMVASPRALGMIREEYSDSLREALIKEIGKDMVKLPIAQIERMVVDEIAA